jgi:rSAM/selenodomain-associated transferase 1
MPNPPASACLAEVLLLFVRHPEAGRVKTRLIPLLGEVGAAGLYRQMAGEIARRLGEVARPGLARVALVEPPQRQAEVGRWLGNRFTPWPQAVGDLGVRLTDAFQRAFDHGAARVVAVGTDCLDLSTAILHQAFDRLAASDAVLGPAIDGGYYLIGLRRPLPVAFEGIPWSTDATLAVTRQRLGDVGATCHLLPVLRDLDTADDLAALLPRWREVLAPASTASDGGP